MESHVLTPCVDVGSGLKQPMPELIVHVDSLDIFPVSWCETNGYPLVYPIKPSGIQHESSEWSLCVCLYNTVVDALQSMMCSVFRPELQTSGIFK